MKVKVGNYPYRLACNIHFNYMNKKYGFTDWPNELEYSVLESSLEALEDSIQAIYNVFNWILFDRRTQKVKVKIDPWDTWSMDHTLAHIILPMLKQLKETKHGSALVDDEDVPHLPKKQWSSHENSQGDVFESNEQDALFWQQYEVRWNWVLDEMIYAFDCKVNKDEVYMRFERITDSRAMYEEQERISNGFRLFGKYFESLWD